MGGVASLTNFHYNKDFKLKNYKVMKTGIVKTFGNVTLETNGLFHYLKIWGHGHQKRSNYFKVYLAKGIEDKLLKEIEGEEFNFIEWVKDNCKLDLNKRSLPILRFKGKAEQCITLIGYTTCSFRGSSGIEFATGLYYSATGVGAYEENTGWIKLFNKENPLLITWWSGRYNKGYEIYHYNGNEIKFYEIKEEGKYCDYPAWEEVEELLERLNLLEFYNKNKQK